MDIDIDMCEYALKLASVPEVKYADVRMENQERNDIVLKNGVLDVASHSFLEGLCVRIFTEEGVGFCSTTVVDKKSVGTAVKEAIRQSRACKRKNPPKLSEEKTVKAQWSVPEKIKLSNVGIEDKLEGLFLWEKGILSLGDVPARIIYLVDKMTEKVFLDSEGSIVEGYLPIVNVLYFISVKCDNQVEQAMKRFGYAGGWEGFHGFKAAEDAEKEVKMLQRLMKEGRKSPEGLMDLVVGPDVVGIVCHESCGHPMEADRILGREASQAGASFMSKDLLGTKIGSKEVTVAEDPTVEHSFGYYAYDDEGVKARRRFLFKEGTINEFLCSRESAALMETSSNGAARSAGYNREPLVRMANTFLMPGDFEKGELIEDVRLGIYMESYTEWNIDDKRYNQKYIGRESYLIENGEITHMVKRPILEVTTPAFWKAIDARGKDLEFRAGNCGKGEPLQEMDVFYGGPVARLRGIYMR